MNNHMTFGVIKNMVCCMAIILPLQLGAVLPVDSERVTETNESETIIEEPAPKKTNVVLMDLKEEYCDTNCYLIKNRETVDFLSNTFGVNSDILISNLIEINKNTKYNINNIGLLKDNNGNLLEFDSFEKGLIEYLYEYTKENPNLVDKTYTPYTGNAEYVVNLIKYFTGIYNNVDYLTAVSIGAAESGYYKVTYMLKYNNIYGGMGNNGLIKYKNIEYGVLSYIRLLSNSYYGKGLNTVESIGKVYCPTYNENGVKTASSHWINLVYTAMNYYQDDTEEVFIEDLRED